MASLVATWPGSLNLRRYYANHQAMVTLRDKTGPLAGSASLRRASRFWSRHVTSSRSLMIAEPGGRLCSMSVTSPHNHSQTIAALTPALPARAYKVTARIRDGDIAGHRGATRNSSAMVHQFCLTCSRATPDRIMREGTCRTVFKLSGRLWVRQALSFELGDWQGFSVRRTWQYCLAGLSSHSAGAPRVLRSHAGSYRPWLA